LPRLQYLELSNNKLNDLPLEIVNLQNLTRLDISNNCIADLPYCLAQLPNLISLQVEGNPIKSIRCDILARGTTRILKTLRERCPSNFDEMSGDGLNAGGPPASQDNSIFPDK